MDIKSPKEIVSDISNLTDSKKREALFIRTKSTVNGAFWGGALGFMFSSYKQQNKYMGTLIDWISFVRLTFENSSHIAFIVNSSEDTGDELRIVWQIPSRADI